MTLTRRPVALSVFLSLFLGGVCRWWRKACGGWTRRTIWGRRTPTQVSIRRTGRAAPCCCAHNTHPCSALPCVAVALSWCADAGLPDDSDDLNDPLEIEVCTLCSPYTPCIPYLYTLALLASPHLSGGLTCCPSVSRLLRGVCRVGGSVRWADSCVTLRWV